MAEAQNFHVAVKNHTQYTFQPQTESMSWGGVYDKQTIKPRTTTINAFYTRGDRNAASGTQGSLKYAAEQDPAVSLTFSWDIPWGVGTDSLNITTTGPIKLEKSSFTGDQVLRKVVEVIVKDDTPLS